MAQATQCVHCLQPVKKGWGQLNHKKICMGAPATYKVSQTKTANQVDTEVDDNHNIHEMEGEGQDEAKPCPVISIDEELFYLSMFGFKFEGQHGQLCSDGTACDVIDVTDPKTRKGYVLYMDISRPLARLQGDQGKAEAPPPPPPP